MENLLRTIQIPFKITDRFVDDVMCTALSGGINYWLGGYICEDYKEREYMYEVISAGGEIGIIDEDGNSYVLDLDVFCDGFKKYVDWSIKNNKPVYFDPSDIDAEIADIIIQFGIFDEIIYG